MSFKFFNFMVFALILVLSIVAFVSLPTKNYADIFSNVCLAICCIALCVVAGIFVHHEEQEVMYEARVNKMLRDAGFCGHGRCYGTYDFGYNGAIRDIKRTLRWEMLDERY